MGLCFLGGSGLRMAHGLHARETYYPRNIPRNIPAKHTPTPTRVTRLPINIQTHIFSHIGVLLMM